MRLRFYVLAAVALLLAVFVALYYLLGHGGGEGAGLLNASEWQRMALPGELSQPHAFLEHTCASCHSPVKGVEAASCIVCHANNEALLERQPTAFHAEVPSCAECHLEHQGRDRRPTQMDHGALARISLRQLEAEGSGGRDNLARQQLLSWSGRYGAPRAPDVPPLKAREALLDCATCHDRKDRHRGLFGEDCSQCHGTSQWTIPEFLHPSPRSLDCDQCHQAPPSHYMEHFRMVSMRVADQPHAKVNQCYQCHQTTSWNDIKGVGWYKHH